MFTPVLLPYLPEFSVVYLRVVEVYRFIIGVVTHFLFRLSLSLDTLPQKKQ